MASPSEQAQARATGALVTVESGFPIGTRIIELLWHRNHPQTTRFTDADAALQNGFGLSSDGRTSGMSVFSYSTDIRTSHITFAASLNAHWHFPLDLPFREGDNVASPLLSTLQRHGLTII